MTAIGIIFLLVGLAMLFKPSIKWMIDSRNMMMGTQTKITSGTILFYRIIAIIWIFISLLLATGIITNR